MERLGFRASRSVPFETPTSSSSTKLSSTRTTTWSVWPRFSTTENASATWILVNDETGTGVDVIRPEPVIVDEPHAVSSVALHPIDASSIAKRTLAHTVPTRGYGGTRGRVRQGAPRASC